MMDSLSRRIDHIFSWRSLKWRWEAFRSGKPFAEIVVLNTLGYRVEQLFLIHAETGLLLQHVSADAAPRDPELVSAMLTAIRDFVKDSFRSGTESLDTLQVGELVVAIEQGPHAVLAAVVRGNLRPDVRVMFQDAIEAIHLQQGLDLQAFDGDVTPFQRSRHILEACLIPGSNHRWLDTLHSGGDR